MAQSFTSTSFIEARTKAMQAAADQLNQSYPNGYTDKQISEYVPTGNNLKKSYLHYDLLKEVGKDGHCKLYKFVVDNITAGIVSNAYKMADHLSNKTEGNVTSVVLSTPKESKEPQGLTEEEVRSKWGNPKHTSAVVNTTENTVKNTSKQEITTQINTVVNNTVDPFPSVDDCIAYLKHYYGNVAVIPLPVGYEISNMDISKIK